MVPIVIDCFVFQFVFRHQCFIYKYFKEAVDEPDSFAFSSFLSIIARATPLRGFFIHIIVLDLLANTIVVVNCVSCY